MASQRKASFQHPLPRVGIALAVVALHVAVIAWIVLARISAPATLGSISVEVLPQEAPAPDLIKLSMPNLLPVSQLSVEQPEVRLPNDALIAAVARDEATPPTSSAPAQSAAPPALPAMSDVSYLEPPKPSYPRQARLAREEGLVVLRVLIDESGHVKDIEVFRSSGHTRLDEEARNAVARALFRPYSANGVAQPAVAMVPIEFSLHRS
jgi:periplasmic protein TonB